MRGPDDATAGIPPEVAGRIRLVFLDADGVLTDGGIYVADGPDEGPPHELRRFDVRDGIALHLLRHAGIDVAVISARASPAVRARARSLGIQEVHQVGPLDKLGTAREVLERRGAGWEEAAFLGDDLPDLPVLRRVGLPATVADAAPEVRAAARWVADRVGGKGAVREFVEALLRARGEWEGLVERYLEACEAAAQRPTGPPEVGEGPCRESSTQREDGQ